jgi:hypothetical protein
VARCQIPLIVGTIAIVFDVRKKATADLVSAFEKAVTAYEKADMRPVMAKTHVELANMVEQERKWLANRDKPADIKSTKELIGEFYAQLARAIEEIEGQPTTAKCDEMIKVTGKTLDEGIKRLSANYWPRFLGF